MVPEMQWSFSIFCHIFLPVLQTSPISRLFYNTTVSSPSWSKLLLPAVTETIHLMYLTFGVAIDRVFDYFHAKFKVIQMNSLRVFVIGRRSNPYMAIGQTKTKSIAETKTKIKQTGAKPGTKMAVLVDGKRSRRDFPARRQVIYGKAGQLCLYSIQD